MARKHIFAQYVNTFVPKIVHVYLLWTPDQSEWNNEKVVIQGKVDDKIKRGHTPNKFIDQVWNGIQRGMAITSQWHYEVTTFAIELRQGRRTFHNK